MVNRLDHMFISSPAAVVRSGESEQHDDDSAADSCWHKSLLLGACSLCGRLILRHPRYDLSGISGIAAAVPAQQCLRCVALCCVQAFLQKPDPNRDPDIRIAEHGEEL